MQNHQAERSAQEKQAASAMTDATQNVRTIEAAENVGKQFADEALKAVVEDPIAEFVPAPVSAEEFESMKSERDQLLDRLARLQAEFENARKRGERERKEYHDYATGSVVEQFLPVLDNFELALKANGSAEQLRAGVELIMKQMEEVLRQLHVQPVASVGEPFDPHQHEAMGTMEREDMPDHSVAEEVRKGYRLRERLLRPALVRVVSNPKQTVA